MTGSDASSRLLIEIAGLGVALNCEDEEFARLVAGAYSSFLALPGTPAACEFAVHIAPPRGTDPDEDVRVSLADGKWQIRRGDFEAEFDPRARQGWVRHTANPYSVDTVLRIVHTLLAADAGGFLVHAAGAILNGRGLILAGASGAGKTTMCRLAPPDAVLLSDEICYVMRHGEEYLVHGTPFAGELGIPGVKVSAPAAALYLLARGNQHRLVPLKPAEAARQLLRCILFFAEDAELAGKVFNSACEFVRRTPVYRLEFQPEPGVWELLK